MKLGSYFQQSVPVKRKRESAIIVTNDKVKNEFEKKLRVKEADFVVLRQTLAEKERQVEENVALYNDISERHLKALETIRGHEELEAKTFALNTELGQVKQEASKVVDLEQELRELKESFSNLQQERSQIRRQLEITTEDLKEVQNTTESLKTDNHKMNSVIGDYEYKYPIVASNYEHSQNEIEILQNKIVDSDKDMEALTVNFFYWKDTAKDLENQLNEEARLRDEIKRSLEILTYENTLDSKRSTKSSKVYKEAKEEILNLTNRNLELTNFTEQMSKIIIEQRKEIASMGLSQAAIGAKEGFHIPFAKENLRTKQLGNAKPTLLKFKETTDDNN